MIIKRNLLLEPDFRAMEIKSIDGVAHIVDDAAEKLYRMHVEDYVNLSGMWSVKIHQGYWAEIQELEALFKVTPVRIKK